MRNGNATNIRLSSPSDSILLRRRDDHGMLYALLCSEYPRGFSPRHHYQPPETIVIPQWLTPAAQIPASRKRT